MAPKPPPAALSSYIVASNLSHFNTTVKDYLSSRPSTKYIVAGALVLSSGQPTQLLIVQRSASDNRPNLWEIPGGSCDADESILAGTVRELWEETGLVATKVQRQVGKSYAFGGNYQEWRKYSFEVEVRDMEVNLDEEEHQAYFWATEEECRVGSVVRDGEVTRIDWTSDSQLAVILEGFQMRKEHPTAGE